MNAQRAIVRKIAWWYTVPQLMLMFVLIVLLWKSFFPTDLNLAVAYGAIVYLLYSFASKAFLLRNHRRGVYLTKIQSFRDAISAFKLSYAFLRKYAWLDKYRFITMLDSSAVSYREMALCNIAYSYAQLDENVAAATYYRKALAEFPQSAMAKNGIEYVESEGK
jgi:tetratricopeptide (TPR) repeat protein